MWCLILLTATCIHLSHAALPLPAYIKPCARSEPNFNDCALRHAKDAFPRIISGDRKYKVPFLDPMDIEEVSLIDESPGPASLSLVIKNSKVHGMKNSVIEKTEYDFDNQHIHHEITVPRVQIIGKYTVSGRILLLPISGNGDINITLDNVRVKYDEDYTFQVIDGNRHLDPKNPRATAAPSRMYVHLTNLFQGDSLLNKQMNEFLNENWSDVFNELSPTVYSVFTKIVFQIFNGLDKLVPFDAIFPEKLPN